MRGRGITQYLRRYNGTGTCTYLYIPPPLNSLDKGWKSYLKHKEVFMIKESLDYTIRLIETSQKVSPTDYQDKKYELDILVQHMGFVLERLDKK